MNTLRRILTVSSLAVMAVGMASANTITAVQTATGGTLPSLGAGNTPPPSSTGTASVTGFSESAANAAIALACPLGYTCSNATLYEIDLGLTANFSGSVNITNTSGGTLAIPCIPGLGQCDTGSSTATDGYSVEGEATLSITDPNSINVGPGPLTTFLAPTNDIGTTDCTGNSHNNCLVIGTGTTPLSGSNTANDPLTEIYQISDANWATESSPWTATTVNFNLALASETTIGQPEPGGLGSNTNVSLLNSGNLAVQYDYSFTETSGVPEPTTMVLFGSALVGLGCIRKRVRKQ